MRIPLLTLATALCATACDPGPGATLEPGERLYLGGQITGLRPSVDQLDDTNPTLRLLQTPVQGTYGTPACFGDTSYCAEHYNSPVGSSSEDLGFDPGTPVGTFLFRSYNEPEGITYDVRLVAQPVGHHCAIAGDPTSGEGRLFPTHRYTTSNADALRRKIFGGYEYEWFDPSVEIDCQLAPSFAFELVPADAILPSPVVLELRSGDALLETLSVTAEDWALLVDGAEQTLYGKRLAFSAPLEVGQDYSIVVAELPAGFECRITELLGPYTPDTLVEVGGVATSKTLAEDPNLDHAFNMECTRL